MARLAEKLSYRLKKSYSEFMGWVSTRLSFALIRATNICLRGSRVNGGAELEWMMGPVYPGYLD